MRTLEQLGEYEINDIALQIDRTHKNYLDFSSLLPEEKLLYEKLFIFGPHLLDKEETEIITRLYLKHVVGVELPQSPNEWWELPGWRNMVGRRLNGIKTDGEAPMAGSKFWQEAGIAVQGLLKEEDVKFLAEKDPKGQTAFNFLTHIIFVNQPLLGQEVLEAVHAWK